MCWLQQLDIRNRITCVGWSGSEGRITWENRLFDPANVNVSDFLFFFCFEHRRTKRQKSVLFSFAFCSLAAGSVCVQLRSVTCLTVIMNQCAQRPWERRIYSAHTPCLMCVNVAQISTGVKVIDCGCISQVHLTISSACGLKSSYRYTQPCVITKTWYDRMGLRLFVHSDSQQPH